jgi:hypothetical protein
MSAGNSTHAHLPPVIIRQGPYIRVASSSDVELGELGGKGAILKGLQMQEANGDGEWGMFVRRPSSRPERVIVNWWPQGCCGAGGLDEKDRETVPSFLADKGVTSDVWRDFVSAVDRDVTRNTPCCGVTGCLLSWAFCMCCFRCAAYNSFQSKVADFLESANANHFEKLGIFVTTQTVMYDWSDGKNNHHEELSWFAFATTSEEIDFLKSEDHVWRYSPGAPECCVSCCCTCCDLHTDERMYPDQGACTHVYCCCGPQRIF